VAFELFEWPDKVWQRVRLEISPPPELSVSDGGGAVVPRNRPQYSGSGQGADSVADETVWQARAQGIDYPSLRRRAEAGDADAIRELARFSRRADAAGALGHGVELVDILQAVGDERFAAIVAAEDAETNTAVRRVLDAGFAYSRRTDVKRPMSEGFPLTSAALGK
jgi:hypothetical protein